MVGKTNANIEKSNLQFPESGKRQYLASIGECDRSSLRFNELDILIVNLQQGRVDVTTTVMYNFTHN